MRSHVAFCPAAALLLTVAAAPLSATEVKLFRSGSVDDILGGTFDNVSVDALGTVRLADRAERIAGLEEPFLLSAAELSVTGGPGGFLLGTGNSGRVLRVTPGGEVEELFATAEPEVFAVAASDDGTVYAGSSPNGKVYRYRDGEAQELAELGQTYIWALAEGPDGRLLVGTGTEGKLFALSDDGESELLYDAEDPHLRTILVTGGRTLLGTAGSGLVLELVAAGEARTLFDSALPEIVTLAAGEAGNVYIAALASEASAVDLKTPTRSSEKKDDEGDEADKSGSVSVKEGSISIGSRTAGSTGPRSEILRLGSSGNTERLWRFDKETVFDLIFHRDRLWVATGLDGKLFSFHNEQMVLEKDVDEKQIVGLLRDQPGPAFATTSAAAVYRLSEGAERAGSYRGKVLDAGSVASFGTLFWEGQASGDAQVQVSARSGMSAEPDDTWSDWSKPSSEREVTLDSLPRGRYLQWRLELSSAGKTSPEVITVEVAYRQDNLKPEIEELKVLDAGQILVPSNFNPSNQVFEPAHPNREGIFTTVGKPADDGRLKTLWKLGYLALQWKASDANEDDLRYGLSFRREEDADGWLPMAQDWKDEYYNFDATALPDGRYRFRLEASDRRSNLESEALAAERISPSIVVDHGVPELGEVQLRDGRLLVRVSDRWSPLRSAEVSVDGGEWRPAEVSDGLLDSRAEQLRLERPEGARLLLLRVADAAYNGATFDLSGELR